MAYATSSGSADTIVIRGLGGTIDQTAEVQAVFDKVAALSYNYTQTDVSPQPEIVIFGLVGISSGLTLHPAGGIRLRGSGPMAGFRAIAGGTYDMLTIGNGLISSGYSSFIQIEVLVWTSSAQKTGGAGLKIWTAADVNLRNCFIVRQYDGVRFERGCQACQMSGNYVLTFTRYGVYNNVTAINQGTNGYGSEGHYIDNYIYSGNPGAIGDACIGVLQEGGDAVHYRGNHIVACGIGMKIAPTTTPVPELAHLEIASNIISDNTHNCLVIDGTNPVAKIAITDNHLVYSLIAGYGLTMTGANLRNVNVRGNFITANATGGIYLGSGPRDILIDGNNITKNAVGITTQSGAQDFRIVNNRCSNTSGGAGGFVTQTHGIVWGGSHENYIYALNDLRGNGTAATSGTPGGSNVVNANNLT